MLVGNREPMPLLYLANEYGEPIVWNGPGSAPASLVPEGTPTRSWAYPVLFNSSSDPRGAKARESEGITFEHEAALADQVHVRAAIETVKNAQTKKEWIPVLEPIAGERATDVALRAKDDPRIAELTAFFREPDGEHDFAEWSRLLFEDLLVHDAPCIHNVRRNNGKPYELEVFPGSTIKPLLAADGRSPRGDHEAYQQWLYGQPGDKFTRAEMMYSPRNPRPGKAFGKSPVNQLALYINIALRKDIQRLSVYTEGNIPAGMLPMPQGWSSKEIFDWWLTFNTFVKGLPHNLVKLFPIPGGTGQPIFPSLETNKDQWEESWIRLVCFAFDISVSSLVKEMNRATAEVSRDSVEQDGAAAYTDWFRRRLNWIVRKWFGYSDIVFKQKREVDVDLLKQTQADQIELQQGTLQVNEKREREGRTPIAALEGKEGYFGPGGWMEFGAQPLSLGAFGPMPGLASAPTPAGSAQGQPSEVPNAAATPTPSQEPVAPAETPAPTVEPLRVGDINAAQSIVKDVAAGTIPRDAGMGQLKLFFKFTDEEAQAIMGSAGLPDVPTTPNPRPITETAAPTPTAPTPETAKAAAPFEFASTQVNILGDVRTSVLALSQTISDSVLHEKGRETDPHVTVKYGIDPKTTWVDVREVIESSDSAKEMAMAGGASLTFGATAIFEADEYDVVYLSIDSPELVLLNQIISEGLTVTDTHPNYVPHATIAYVKKGEGRNYAGNAALAGNTYTFESIAFSDIDGTQTEIPLAGESELQKAGKSDLDKEIEAILKIIRGDDGELQLLAAPFHKEAAKKGATQVAEATDFESILEIDSEHVRAFLEDKSNLIVSVNEATGEKIIGRIAELQNDEGASAEEISKIIEEEFDLRADQADLIANQEVGASLNGGRFLQMEEEEIGKHQWMNSGKPTVRPSHEELDGEIRELGEEFKPNLRYPQDPNAPADESINCECITLPVFDSTKAVATTADKWRAAMKPATDIEQAMAKALRGYFAEQRKRVLAVVT